MHLQLYDSQTTEFKTNGDPINGVYNPHVIRDEGFYLKFKLMPGGEFINKIQHEMIIGAMTPDGMNYFRVFDIDPKDDCIEITALQLFYYLDRRLVGSFGLHDSDGKSAIEALKANFVSSIAPYTFDSSVTDKHDFTTDTTENVDGKYYNALEVINRIATRWDSEFVLNGFDVRMIKRLGKRTQALLYEKKNISSFESESSIRKLVTRIYAKSKWILDTEDKEYVKDAKGNENEREIKVTVDSPLINQYSQIYEAEYTNNNCKTERELINWAKLKYSTDHLDKPSRSINVKTNIIDGTKINYGDDVILRYLVNNVDEEIRCVGYDYDPISEEYYSVSLGDWRQTFGSTVGDAVTDVSERQRAELEELKKNVQIAQMSANDKNRVTYGPNPVPNPIDGDLWFKYTYDRPNEVTIWVYDESIRDWVRQDLTSEEVKRKLEDIDKQLQSANTKSDEIAKQADEAILTATGAKDIAERGKQLADELSAHRTKIDDEINRLKERNTINDEVTAEFITNKELIRYNENRWLGEPYGNLDQGDNCIPIRHNGGGFLIGKEYTVSMIIYPMDKPNIEAPIYMGAYVESEVKYG